MHNYKPNPDNNIGHNGVLILCGLSHKETDQPAWVIPGGTLTTSEREATRIAGLICKIRRGNEIHRIQE